jgi:hypothetical protein
VHVLPLLLQDPAFLKGLVLASIALQRLTAADLAAAGMVTAADGQQLPVRSQPEGKFGRRAAAVQTQKHCSRQLTRAPVLTVQHCDAPAFAAAAAAALPAVAAAAGQTQVGAASVVLPDILASNGVIHITDGFVALPAGG